MSVLTQSNHISAMKWMENDSVILGNSEENSTDLSGNFTYEDFLAILNKNRQASPLEESTKVVFLIIYCSMIVFGVSANGLIGYVIWKKAALRTARNFFIVNLMISDILICVLSMPFTLIKLLHNDWKLGNVICKLIPMCQCTNILVSTATIVAIAVDRYVSIVCTGRSHMTKKHAAYFIGIIWVACFLFTLPLYFHYNVKKISLGNILLYHKCIELQPPRYVKEIWIFMLLLFQYVMPIITLGIVHRGIKRYLNKHMLSHEVRRSNRERRRNRKTTIILSVITMSFGGSWLPWHVVNLLADFSYHAFMNATYLYTVFGSCHIVAMSTVCSNPLLYGWLNTNLRREMSEYIPNFLKDLSRSSKPDNVKSYGNDAQTRNVLTPTFPAIETMSSDDQGKDYRSVDQQPLPPSVLLKDSTL